MFMSCFVAPRRHLLVPDTAARRGPAQLQGPRRGRRAGGATSSHEYVFDSTVGSDSEALAASRRGPSKVTAPRRTRQTARKILAPQAAAQVAEVKKRRGKRTRSAVSANTTTMSSDVEAIDIEAIDIKEDGGDVQSPKATTRRRGGRRRRRPARRLGCRGDLHRAPAQRTTLG
jgi:hypothetical protein